MLSIAISTFFAIAFFGAVTVIAMTFFQYRGKIAQVVQYELNAAQLRTDSEPTHYRHRTIRSRQPMTGHRSLRPVPLRAAA